MYEQLEYKLPKMVGVRAEGCSPIVRAFNENKNTVEPWHQVKTIASGISDPLKRIYSQYGTFTLETIKNSKGYAISVSDKEMIKSVFILGRNQGIYAEPTSASIIRAYEIIKF